MSDRIHDIIEKVGKDLTSQERKNLSDEVFGLPEKRKFPMPDEKHTRLAWQFLNRSKLSEAEKAKVRKRILARAKELGMDTSNWKTAADFLKGLDKFAGCHSEVTKPEDRLQVEVNDRLRELLNDFF